MRISFKEVRHCKSPVIFHGYGRKVAKSQLKKERTMRFSQWAGNACTAEIER